MYLYLCVCSCVSVFVYFYLCIRNKYLYLSICNLHLYFSITGWRKTITGWRSSLLSPNSMLWPHVDFPLLTTICWDRKCFGHTLDLASHFSLQCVEHGGEIHLYATFHEFKEFELCPFLNSHPCQHCNCYYSSCHAGKEKTAWLSLFWPKQIHCVHTNGVDVVTHTSGVDMLCPRIIWMFFWVQRSCRQGGTQTMMYLSRYGKC